MCIIKIWEAQITWFVRPTTAGRGAASPPWGRHVNPIAIPDKWAGELTDNIKSRLFREGS